LVFAAPEPSVGEEQAAGVRGCETQMA